MVACAAGDNVVTAETFENVITSFALESIVLSCADRLVG
jgi:hypothetical protein